MKTFRQYINETKIGWKRSMAICDEIANALRGLGVFVIQSNSTESFYLSAETGNGTAKYRVSGHDSYGTHDDISYEEFVDDINGIVPWLKKQGFIDPTHPNFDEDINLEDVQKALELIIDKHKLRCYITKNESHKVGNLMNESSHITKVGDYSVETWYDKKSRNYVTQTKDAYRFQIGDADYSGTKESSLFAHRMAVKALESELASRT